MRIVTTIVIAAVGSSALAQIPDGATARMVFDKGQIVARGTEIHRIVQLEGQPVRYYASRGARAGRPEQMRHPLL